MRKLILAGALMLALAGCETANTPTVPTTLETHASASVSAASSVQAQQTSFSFCPTVTPFNATIGVVVVAGDINLFVTSITSQFTDTNNIQLPPITAQPPPVTLPAPVPTAQFGSALVEARQGVTFPVTVNFGCGTASAGTVTMAVHLSDANGGESTRNLQVRVN
ncbi:MAG TPA: hypothetical protein VH138_10635 [Vicinamibacterales bacterium]|jgi:hypothetical protein|nr:hypothetical protein [Vicinamibacterales bacterium]